MLHNNGFKLLGSALFLRQKGQQPKQTLAILSKFDDLKAKYNVHSFSLNNKLRHLLKKKATSHNDPTLPNLLPTHGRMDLVITSGDFQPTLADVTITIEINDSMPTAGHFANHSEEINKYQEASEVIVAVFVPLVVETYGSFGKAWQSFLKITATEFFNRS